MIRLSASSIADFLKCSKMYQYRMERSEDSIDTEEQSIGNFVHEVVERNVYFTLDDPLIDILLAEYNIEDTDKALRYLKNFTELRENLILREDDKREFYFREKVNKGLQISGKMDRVNIKDHIIYDWKASTSTKKYLSNDVQCIVYYMMYHKMFGSYPNVFIVNLHHKDIRPFYPKKEYIDTLFNKIIPKIVKEIKLNQFYKTGYFTGSCYRCPFLGVCGLED
jgi:hypothetical protein